MINQVTLVGRLTKDADMRYTPQGTAVASFTLAVNRVKKGEVDFLNCTCFDKTAEAVANYTKKGSMVGVLGSIQTRNYENKEGKKVYVTEIKASNVQFLESKGSGESAPKNDNSVSDFDDDKLPF